MNFINDNSAQTITNLSLITGTFNDLITTNDLNAGLATKQNTLTAATSLLGVGSSITAIDYNNITLNKPTNFQADWNSTIINKPSSFQADWNSTIINKPSSFQADWNSTIINKPDLTIYNAWTKMLMIFIQQF